MMSESLTGGFAIALAVMAAFGLGAWRYALVLVVLGIVAQTIGRSADLRRTAGGPDLT
jgi:hypothetical protein